MENIETAQAVAAVWFTVVFGLALLAPVLGAACKAARHIKRKREETKK